VLVGAGITLPATPFLAAKLSRIRACLMVVIFIPLIPWGYVARHYFLHPGNRWLTVPKP
jgi:hypothetical protein